jgi:glycosyltransferase involved in cell wall biosynthesis
MAKVAHLTTVDLSLRFLIFPQMRAVIDGGGEVVAISAPGPWVAGLEANGIRHIALTSSTRGFDLRADLCAALDLYRVLRKERPDVLHTHNPKPGLYGRVVGRLARVPIVVNTVHGLYANADDPLAKRAVVYTLEGIASRCSDAELVQNPEDLATIRRLRLAPRDRATLLGNGIDLARFDRARFPETHRAATRRALGIADDQVVVGCVGRLVAEKGFRELFDAARALGDRFAFVVIGADDPDKRDALDGPALEDARRNGVRLLGHRDDVDALYPAMDVFALASYREGYPRAAMEAAAMGLPVVATDIRGCREVVDDGVNGLLVPVRDARALEHAIRRLGEDETLRRSMGDAGARIARERFDERRCVEIVMSTYRAVAARKHLTLD